MRSWTLHDAGNKKSSHGIIVASLAQAFGAASVPFTHNGHLHDGRLTDVFLHCQWPDNPPNTRHALNILYTTWEFPSRHIRAIPVTRHYDVVAAMCQFGADAIAPYTKTPVEVVPLGIDTDTFKPYDAAARARARHIWRTDLGIRDDQHLILWVGGTTPRHGFHVAFETLKQLGPEYVLLAKFSPLYPDLFSVPQHPNLRCVFGWQHMPDLYNAADVLLFSAKAAGYGMPVLEAMACGLPVVATDLPPLREFAAGVTLVPGVKVPVFDPVHPEQFLYGSEAKAEDFAAAIAARPAAAPLPTRTWAHVAQDFIDLAEVYGVGFSR